MTRLSTLRAYRRIAGAALCASMLLAAAGCRQDMHNQPKYKPLQPSTFFADGRSSRPLVEGTVARGHLRSDRSFYYGMVSQTTGGNRRGASSGSSNAGAGAGGSGQLGGGGLGNGSGSGLGGVGSAQIGGSPGVAAGTGQGTSGSAAGGNAFDPNYAKEFPYPVTRAMLERGRERYNAFCSPCHAYTGAGNGMIVQRGLTPPPSFHSERLRGAPVGHFFDVITNGYGAMYSYATRVQVSDRWAIIAYVRALQASQGATSEDVPANNVPALTEGQEVLSERYEPGRGNLYLGGLPTLGGGLTANPSVLRSTGDPGEGKHTKQ